jgi:hypothetical protein
MRIFYTIVLLIGVPSAIVICLVAVITIDDLMTRWLGKPPTWIVIVTACFWIFVFIRMAWQLAGKWAE